MRFKRRFALFVSILFLTFLIFTLSACDNDNQSSSKSQSQNMYVSGKIFCKNVPVPDVSILVDGESVSSSNESGSFYLKNLKKNSEISFALQGYSFIPDKIVVIASKSDYVISCVNTAAPDVAYRSSEPFAVVIG